MPFSLLAAIFLAFGFEPASPEVGPGRGLGLEWRLGATLGGVALVGALALTFGRVVALSIDRRRGATPAIRRGYAIGCRAVDLLNLAVFAAIIHGAGWPAAVESGFGLRGSILADEFLILLPYLLGQLVGWWGLYAGELAVRAARAGGGPIAGPGRYLVAKARQALGLVLPVATTFALGQDVLRRRWPESAEEPLVQLAWMAAMGGFVLVLAPAFVRLTWPARPLAPGPLRERLEGLARRFGFRCSDILVWDTGLALVNAGVTGALPWFRYVLLTDALVEGLDDHEIEAVFGHEIGHIAHRHLLFFGFFFLGSVGVMGLVYEATLRLLDLDRLGTLLSLGWWDPATVGMVVQQAVLLGSLGLYFLLIFGHLSRRFERQADVFGCRAVSCGHVDCPPHADPNARVGADPGPPPTTLCPVGIRIFINALLDVARLNGIARDSRWAWRHGSIARRIAFLEGLEGRPEAERRFQSRVRVLRVGLGVVLTSALVAAWYAGSLGVLR